MNKDILIIGNKNLEWFIIISVFIFSCFNYITLIISMILLILYFRQGEIGAIKILNIITLRTIINPGLAIDIGSAQKFKWMIIMISATYLIIGYRKLFKNDKEKLNKILLISSIYTIYSIVSSLYTSTLPTIAIFKVLSYWIVLLGVMIGVFNTYKKFDWLEWMYKIFLILIIFSLPLLNNPIGYLRNGYSFQGITNQPNMLGLVLPLFFANVLVKIKMNKFRNFWIPYVLIILLLILGVLTKSRTSLISMTFLYFVYIIIMKKNTIEKILTILLSSICIIVYILIDNRLIYAVQSFLYKGQENILFSRINQMGRLIENFMRNPLFGSGFAVPVTPFRTFAFSSNYVVEPGNLIMAVLSYGGIIGFILFSIYMIKVFWSNKRNFNIVGSLLISVLLISMGEMVFFSSNNIGIWIYMYISMYIVYDKESVKI